MGTCQSVDAAASSRPDLTKANSQQNMHVVLPELKVHTVVTGEMDDDHRAAMKIPLGETTDEQLMAEVARRNLDLHDTITKDFVKKTYEFGRVLGHGASGEVVEVSHLTQGGKFACKVVKKDARMNDAKSMSTEIEIMKRIRHQYVVSMYELYETPKCLWIILELVQGGDLTKHLAESPNYSEADASRHMKQMVSGVHYLHSLGVVHRDLKLDNILLSVKGPEATVKIADFGLSALVRLGSDGYVGGNTQGDSEKRKRYKGLVDMWGTKEYFAPEMIDQAYGPQADVWALGCILYELLCGHYAFPNYKARSQQQGDADLYGRIQAAKYKTDQYDLPSRTPEVMDLLSKMLVRDPIARYSASECLTHRWITNQSECQSWPLTDTHNYMKSKYEKRKQQEEKAKMARHH